MTDCYCSATGFPGPAHLIGSRGCIQTEPQSADRYEVQQDPDPKRYQRWMTTPCSTCDHKHARSWRAQVDMLAHWCSDCGQCPKPKPTV